jgi:hypothetical protein
MSFDDQMVTRCTSSTPKENPWSQVYATHVTHRDVVIITVVTLTRPALLYCVTRAADQIRLIRYARCHSVVANTMTRARGSTPTVAGASEVAISFRSLSHRTSPVKKSPSTNNQFREQPSRCVTANGPGRARDRVRVQRVLPPPTGANLRRANSEETIDSTPTVHRHDIT